MQLSKANDFDSFSITRMQKINCPTRRLADTAVSISTFHNRGYLFNSALHPPPSQSIKSILVKNVQLPVQNAGSKWRHKHSRSLVRRSPEGRSNSSLTIPD
jgi:hypothetical protein